MATALKPTALKNARIFDGTDFLQDQVVILEAGLIRELLPLAVLPPDMAAVDLGGLTLAPGFIDLQVNGGAGALFNDCRDKTSVATIAKAHRQYGSTGLLATVISDSPETMSTAAGAIAEACKDPASGVIGIHFEGPFLNPGRSGVHDPGFIREFDQAELDSWQPARFATVVMTVAPECLPPAAIAELTKQGIRLSAGHSLASYEETLAAIKDGLSGFTHLFNAMPQLHSRAPGIIAAALEDPDTWCGLIVDDHHVHPAMLKLAIARKPEGKMVLVTDAMACVGSGQTEFQLQGAKIRVIDGRCLNDDDTLAGSSLSMIAAVRNAVDLLQIPLSEALRMAALYPAGFLALQDQLGRIAAGFQANLVAFDDDYRVHRTWINAEMQRH